MINVSECHKVISDTVDPTTMELVWTIVPMLVPRRIICIWTRVFRSNAEAEDAVGKDAVGVS